METQQALSQMVPTPNMYFWYVIATLFGAGLLWLIKRDMDKKDKILTTLTEAVNMLTTAQAVHEQRINRIDEDVAEIKKKL